MRRLALLVPLLSTTVLIACSDEAPPAQGGALGEVSDSIINGTPDTTHQAVVFVDMGNYACSGTIIAVNGNYAYVLTAAHCITPHTPQGVVVGNNYTTGAYYPAVESQAHPAYAGDGTPYDFGMIRVTGASGSTPVIPAATSPDGLHVGSVVRHVGYGLISYPNGDTTTRHYGDNTIAELSSSPPEFDYNQPTIGPCSGDSGGPALSTSGPEVVVGTVSRGDGTCDIQGISERVAAVHDTFIQPFIDGTPIGPLTCDECWTASTNGSGACAGAVNTCYNDTDCYALLTCFNGCGNNYSCQQTCVNQHPSGWGVYQQIGDCVCQTGCVTECANDASCQGGTGGSGTGGSGTGGSGTGNTGNTGTGASGQGASGQGAGAPGDGWVAGDTPDQKYSGTYVSSSCSVGSRSAGAGAAWMSLWAVAAGLGVAARRRRRG